MLRPFLGLPVERQSSAGKRPLFGQGKRNKTPNLTTSMWSPSLTRPSALHRYFFFPLGFLCCVLALTSEKNYRVIFSLFLVVCAGVRFAFVALSQGFLLAVAADGRSKLFLSFGPILFVRPRFCLSGSGQ